MSNCDDLTDLQTYTTTRPLALGQRARGFHQGLIRALVTGRRSKLLKTSIDDIATHVTLLDEATMATTAAQMHQQLRNANLHSGAFCIYGCPKNLHRDPDAPHFLRDDGAWFDFSIVIRETADHLALLAYDFEIRFTPAAMDVAPAIGTAFIRFDLNLPSHSNQSRDLRCHLHPGSDDILVPAPLMTPQEVLWLFIHGLRSPVSRKPRAPTMFEQDWLARTCAKWAHKAG